MRLCFRVCVRVRLLMERAWWAVVTGEEEEDTVYQVRGKLFALSSQNQWKERGTGMLRLNVRRADGTGARLGQNQEFGCFLIFQAGS